MDIDFEELALNVFVGGFARTTWWCAGSMLHRPRQVVADAEHCWRHSQPVGFKNAYLIARTTPHCQPRCSVRKLTSHHIWQPRPRIPPTQHGMHDRVSPPLQAGKGKGDGWEDCSVSRQERETPAPAASLTTARDLPWIQPNLQAGTVTCAS